MKMELWTAFYFSEILHIKQTTNAKITLSTRYSESTNDIMQEKMKEKNSECTSVLIVGVSIN